MSHPTLLIPLRTPIHTHQPACNNAVLQLPAFYQPTNLRVYTRATNTDDPNPMASAVDVLLNSTPVQDANWRGYILLNGLSLSEVGRWRVELYGVVFRTGENLWRISAGYVQVEIGFVDVRDGPYLCYQPDTTLNHNHNPVKSNMSPPQQPLSSPPPRHSEPSNPQSGAPPIDLSPLPFPTTPIILIPLRNSILDKFEDDSCNPAVIRLPAQEARFGGLSIHAYATKLLGTDTAAGAYIQNQAQAQNINAFINACVDPPSARQLNRVDLFNPVDVNPVDPAPGDVITFDLADLINGWNAVNRAPASQVNFPLNGNPATPVNLAPIDPANLFNGGPVNGLNPPSAVVVNGDAAVIYFHTRLNAIPVEDTLGQRSLVLSGLRFQDAGDWHVYIQLVRDGASVWWFDAGVIKVIDTNTNGVGPCLDEIGTGPLLCKDIFCL
ncbi:unnamed protein product [Sordaria macrospora k-hell]|uniref:WGS project CABT00000000 data, contig 2.69 n=1 Tax=Sordaria macrospora (strain ATCC MYA-333 / DSM 997 / K(L3346) / K-hell) TaxID=771870 RepID=F7WB22_SORMK|nr:uncharacterized protein SMAC_08903 [Sordaria macrospora k-hell]CCC14314.1 unnamed protein product [Sordaria macrospora k-hell]